ncbi:MAG: class I SAM-dependent methyltransferase [Caldilineaceae bacterium]
MDELARYNQARWEELAQARLEFTLPLLDLTPERARQRIDPEQLFGDLRAQRVLCLATGGGQQSAMFGLLGAQVTVLDLSPTQLQRDKEAAAHYGYTVRTVLGDMRDLAVFANDSFDLVYQAYSLNFVPSVAPVFREVARVLRPGGLYQLQWANPFTQSVDDQAWDGETYLLCHPYIDGFETSTYYPTWDIEDDAGGWRQLDSPREFRHTLATVVNQLAANHLMIIKLKEALSDDPNPAPGTWEHYKSVAPPYLTLWALLAPAHWPQSTP